MKRITFICLIIFLFSLTSICYAEQANLNKHKSIEKYADYIWTDDSYYYTDLNSIHETGTSFQIKYNENMVPYVYISCVSLVDAKIAGVHSPLQITGETTGKFTFDDDGWGHKGYGIISFEGDKIKVKITITQSSEDPLLNRWSIGNKEYIFYKKKVNTNFSHFDVNGHIILPQSGSELKDFIPDQWKLISSAKGDLNNDGLDDIVTIIKRENTPRGFSRVLFALLQSEDSTYKLSVQTDKAIFLPSDGGTYEDSFNLLEINRGSILIKFHGNDAIEWASSFRFRFQNNNWYLIGATFSGYNSNNITAEEKDFNLLTGFMKRTIIVNNKKNSDMINIGEKKLIKLQDFDIYTTTASFLELQ